jgi:hypothetical protein
VDGVLVHRRVCLETHGPAPADKPQAAHSCGNRPCCNKRHVRWASQSDNEQDKLEHGTYFRGFRGTNKRGESNATAKLTEDDIIEIRALAGSASRRQIADQFGVTPENISSIVLRKTWRHVA